MAIIDAYVTHFSLLDSSVSEQGNTVTITRDYMMRLSDSWVDPTSSDSKGVNGYDSDYIVLTSDSVPKTSDHLESFGDNEASIEFYENVGFYVTARTAKPMFKASPSGDAVDTKTWRITIIYTGEGILFKHLSTAFVKVVNVESGVTPYNFNVTKAYHHSLTQDDETDDPGAPTKQVENTAGDAFSEGLTSVKNIVYIRITLDYMLRETFQIEWKNQYSNIVNDLKEQVYGHWIEPLCGLITIESYKYFHSETEIYRRHRVSYLIQIKELDDSIGGWVPQVVNNGFQAYGLPNRADGVKDKITMGDFPSSTTVKHPENPVSDAVKLDLSGEIQLPDANPVLLPFLIQSFRDWAVLSLPQDF